MRRTRLILAFLLFVMACALKPANALDNDDHFQWIRPPTIVVCYQDFPIYLLYRAVDFWKTRGKEIEDIIPNAPSGICSVAHIPDTIIIRQARHKQLKMGQLAVTERRADPDGNMISSVIWFDPKRIHYRLIIEHELGHGLGLGHVNRDNHVMNPWTEKMGLDYWIP
jgi:hypothetical protein